MEKITEERAKRALEFIAGKLGGKCVLIRNRSAPDGTGTLFVGVRNKNGLLLYMLTSSKHHKHHNATSILYNDVSALKYYRNWVDVAREVVGKAVFAGNWRHFACPDSLEELLIMADLEA